MREVIKAIDEFVATYLADFGPFVRMPKAIDIFRKVAIDRQLLVSAH